jgi:Core binding factor beta subunit
LNEISVGLQAIVATGTNFQLVFGPGTWGFNSDANRDCDFDKEPGKVSST